MRGRLAIAIAGVCLALPGCGDGSQPARDRTREQTRERNRERERARGTQPQQKKLVGDPARGRRVFERNNCWDCHASEPDAWWGGPTMHDYWGSEIKLESGKTVTVDRQHFTQSLTDPYARIAEGMSSDMPSYKGRFSDQEMEDLIAYVKSLEPETSDNATQAAGDDDASQDSQPASP